MLCVRVFIKLHITAQSGVCVCVFVFFPIILDIKYVGRTSRGHTGVRSHRIFIHLPSAVRALIFLAKRIQPFISLVDREAEFLCTNNLIVLHSLGIFFFLVRKTPFTGDDWPCAGGLSAVNAIGTQLRDPINSGLTRWR